MARQISEIEYCPLVALLPDGTTGHFMILPSEGGHTLIQKRMGLIPGHEQLVKDIKDHSALYEEQTKWYHHLKDKGVKLHPVYNMCRTWEEQYLFIYNATPNIALSKLEAMEHRVHVLKSCKVKRKRTKADCRTPEEMELLDLHTRIGNLKTKMRSMGIVVEEEVVKGPVAPSFDVLDLKFLTPSIYFEAKGILSELYKLKDVTSKKDWYQKGRKIHIYSMWSTYESVLKKIGPRIAEASQEERDLCYGLMEFEGKIAASPAAPVIDVSRLERLGSRGLIRPSPPNMTPTPPNISPVPFPNKKSDEHEQIIDISALDAIYQEQMKNQEALCSIQH